MFERDNSVPQLSEIGSLRQLDHSVLVVRRRNLKPLIAAIALATLIIPTFTQVAIAGSPIEVMVAGAQTIEPTGSLETMTTASAPANPANRASRDRDAANTRDLQAKQVLLRDSTFSAKPRWSSLGKPRAKREDQQPRFSRAAAALSYYSIQSVSLILGVGF